VRESGLRRRFPLARRRAVLPLPPRRFRPFDKGRHGRRRRAGRKRQALLAVRVLRTVLFVELPRGPRRPRRACVAASPGPRSRPRAPCGSPVNTASRALTRLAVASPKPHGQPGPPSLTPTWSIQLRIGIAARSQPSRAEPPRLATKPRPSPPASISIDTPNPSRIR